MSKKSISQFPAWDNKLSSIHIPYFLMSHMSFSNPHIEALFYFEMYTFIFMLFFAFNKHIYGAHPFNRVANERTKEEKRCERNWDNFLYRQEAVYTIHTKIEYSRGVQLYKKLCAMHEIKTQRNGNIEKCIFFTKSTKNVATTLQRDEWTKKEDEENFEIEARLIKKNCENCTIKNCCCCCFCVNIGVSFYNIYRRLKLVTLRLFNIWKMNLSIKEKEEGKKK